MQRLRLRKRVRIITRTINLAHAARTGGTMTTEHLEAELAKHFGRRTAARALGLEPFA